MDVYQIWITYNKKWSQYQIIVFIIILVLTVIVLEVGIYKKKLRLIQAVAVIVLIVFLGIVFASTVFTRTKTVRQYKLIPFWSWKAIVRYHDRKLLKENLLNCILLFPVGVLLPIIKDNKVKWYQALVIGMMISAIIEFSQLILMCGLFEWDDMIHNGIGCMAGCLMMDYIIEGWKNVISMHKR